MMKNRENSECNTNIKQTQNVKQVRKTKLHRLQQWLKGGGGAESKSRSK